MFELHEVTGRNPEKEGEKMREKKSMKKRKWREERVSMRTGGS